MKKSKYNNKPTYRIINGESVHFDSIKEARRFDQLILMAKNGTIKELTLQPEYILQDAFRDRDGKHHRAIKYVSDFRYKLDGNIVVEDVKSSAKFQTDVYRIKKKLFIRKYGNKLIFKEVF